MVKSRLLILLIAGWPAWAGATFPEAAIRWFQSQEGLPDLEVFQVSQDSQGWIWLATRGGWIRHEGEQLRAFGLGEGLPREDIRFATWLNNGQAWVSSSAATVIWERNARPLPAPIGERRLFSVLEDGQGRIWCSTNEQVFMYQPTDGQARAWNREELQLSGKLLLEAPVENGMLISGDNGWVILNTSGIQQRVDLTLVPRAVAHQAPRLYPLNAGSWLIAGASAWYRWEARSQALEAWAPAGLPEPATVQCLILQPNEWYCATREGDLYYGAEGHSERWLEQLPLHHLFLDQQHNLWLATREQGLGLMTAAMRRQHRQSQALKQQLAPFASGPWVYQARATNGRRLLAAADGTLLAFRYQSERVIPDWQIGLDRSLSEVFSLPEAEWLVWGDDWLGWIGQNGNLRRELALPGLQKLGQLPDGWMFCFREGLHVYLPNEQLPALFQQASAPISWLQDQHEWVQVPFTAMAVRTPDHTFWVANVNGLHPVRQLRQLTVLPDPVEVAGECSDLTVDEAGNVWAAMGGQGVLRLTEGQPEWFQRRLHGSALKVHSLRYDPETSDMWVLSEAGFGKVWEGDHWVAQPLWLGKPFGLGNSVHHRVWLDPELFSFVEDSAWQALPRQQPVPDSISLTVCCVAPATGGSCHPDWDNLRRISRDSASLRISVGHNSYATLGQHQLQYRLQGQDWTAVQQGQIGLFSLATGRYQLDLRLLREQQVLAQADHLLQWRIPPPIYQNWWFVLLVSVLAIGLLWVSMRLYYESRQRKQLKALVEERTRSLDASVQELRRSNEDLEQFAYIASHDLRSPLRGMIGHLQLMQRRLQGKLQDAEAEFLGFAISEAKRLHEMVNDLLDYASVGSSKLEKRRISMQDMMNRMRESILGKAGENQMQILYGDLPTVEVVPVQWEALFRNLVENGLKFNESDQPTVQIETRQQDGFWLFAISDNGIGLDASYIQRAFELYGRVHDEYPGTGIGLAICKRVAERHGGTIWVESTPGQGSTFFVSLPDTSSG